MLMSQVGLCTRADMHAVNHIADKLSASSFATTELVLTMMLKADCQHG